MGASIILRSWLCAHWKSEFPENYWHYYILTAIQEPGSLFLQDDHVKR